MAYPIITDYFRHLVAWQNLNTGLPEDQYVNNFYFRNDFVAGTPQEIHDACQRMVEGFYASTTATNPITQYLSNDIGNPIHKTYDLGVPAPRFPIVDPTVGTLVTSATTALPREVALVASFSSGNGPRRKGRVYIGPLGMNTVGSGANGEPVPLTAVINALRDGCLDLLNSTENMTWATVSPTAAEGHPVVDGWVDDGWDTQRSRGSAATSRTVWP